MLHGLSLARATTLALIVTLAGTGCAEGGANDAGTGRDGGAADAGPRDAAPPPDGGPRDAGPTMDAAMLDAGDPDGGLVGEECDGVICDAFEYCDVDRCRPYPPCAGDGSCPGEDEVCRHRRCLPCDVDIDGDGYTACEDCDETNPDINPGAPERCNGIDDNCSGTADDGDPAEMCQDTPEGGECVDAMCVCPEGRYDVDRTVLGCECEAIPALGIAPTCAGPIDLGDLRDNSADRVTQTGTAMPSGREVWYRFRGVDVADTSCDQYHVRVTFLENPDDTYEFSVFRGSCDQVECGADGHDDYRWATDFRGTVGGRLAGQCPCTSPAAPRMNNVSLCSNDTSEYFVRVRRRQEAVSSCDAYVIEFSNGLYDS